MSTDLDFLGGRPTRNSLELFAIGYNGGHADTVCDRAPVWAALGRTDAEHHADAPLYHEAWQLGREDAERGLRDVHDAHRRYAAGYRAGPRKLEGDLENTNTAVDIVRAIVVGLAILGSVVGFGWLAAILDLVN